jgi:hypothetical protein
MDKHDILARIEQCQSLIKNWEAMKGVDFDYQDVQIDGLLVDKQADERDEKWEISLLTTMLTRLSDGGRDVYSVRWRFRDLWGNLAFFSLQGYQLRGALSLHYIDYGEFAVVGFAIVQPDGTPIFKFNEPDEVSVVSVELTKHRTLKEIFPEDFFEEQ